PILTAVSIIMLCRMHIVYKNYFLFEQPEDSQSLSETISGEKCIFVFNGDLWLMTCIAPEAIDAESCYVTTEYDVKNNDSLDDVFELEENEKIYLVIPKLSEDDDDDEDDTEYGIYVNVPLKSSTLISSNEILKKINSLEGVSNIGYLYSINVQGATYGVYEIS
ncbi:MAG: hypothetical protein Q4E74_11125, partial [Ruminococcus sp.]|nr:hypothetical protein [Ruminococcus sp.]